jgi:NADPH:quinone reductase-like Zn-dependent oxidoreductase
VHGVTGAVGVFAIQLARLQGAHVITTVSAHNIDFAKELGAHEALDYKVGRFEDEVRNIDVVFDTVGGETLERS